MRKGQVDINTAFSKQPRSQLTLGLHRSFYSIAILIMSSINIILWYIELGKLLGTLRSL